MNQTTRLTQKSVSDKVSGGLCSLRAALVCLLLCASPVFAIEGAAQNASKVQINSAELSIDKFFNEVERQTGFLVVYSTEDLRSNFNVSLKKTSGDLKEMLDEALAGSKLTYSLSDKYIVLSAAKESASAPKSNSVRGKVVDKAGVPVVGASVLVKGTTVGTSTDLDGNYSIEAAPAATLEFSFIGYYSEDSSIIGFSHTHLSGTGVPEMGDILLMPAVGDVPFESGSASDSSTGYRSSFSHESEFAAPGYYKVRLDDYSVDAELSATDRVGCHKYTYPASDLSGILVDLQHGLDDVPIETSLAMVSDTVLVGKRRSKGWSPDHSYYFYAVLSKPIASLTSFVDGKVSDSRSVSGTATKMLLRFSTSEREAVTVKVALSTVSIEGAKKNLLAEAAGRSFEDIRSQATSVWNSYLSRFEIEPMDEEQRVSFYTSLYHSLLMPNLVSDVDGSCRQPDGSLSDIGGDYYTNFSVWDTYRSEHPFFVLAFPGKNNDFALSLLDRFKHEGTLSTAEYAQTETWCMIGNHAVPVLADVYLKRLLPEKDREIADAIYTSLTRSHEKSDWETYDKFGYYPFDIVPNESVSRTLEHTYDDYCAALVARADGSPLLPLFEKRSDYFKNLFDPGTKLMRGKDSAGEWRTPFNTLHLSHESTAGGDYTEGNAWQYTWHVQHDIPALVELMGGPDAFESKLDSLFTYEGKSAEQTGFVSDVTGLVGQYAHGNEPSHHVAYLYDHTSSPHKTQALVRDIFDKFYKTGRDGLCGNDDCGQMSAWFLFSAMGFYPVYPVSGVYLLGAPQVKSLKLRLENGKTFSMRAENLSKDNKFVASATIDGKPVKDHRITYEDITTGGELVFKMTSKAE